ncbi:MAG: glycosyltransferase family 4 protein [Mucilaginibacter sp.]
MKIVLSHPTGNQFVRALVSALSDKDLLKEFHTTLAVSQSDFWLKFLPGGTRNELLRRSFPLPPEQIITHPFLEIARLTLPRLGIHRPVRHETGWASVDAIYRNVDKRVAERISLLIKRGEKIDAVYAYEDGAFASFANAKQSNINCLYDLPIGYWRAAQLLLKAEQERWPDWAATLTGLNDSVQKLERKDEELRLADKIFVASRFTAKTLEYYPGKLAAVKVVPYGFPPVTLMRDYKIGLSAKRPLKLLFVGGLSQRKGIANLFEAVSIFGSHVELTIVGNKVVQECRALDEALAKHSWIPGAPHQEILNIMQQHDVLIFPSLFEGFGLVITEAMAQGTPVITTERTAGPDVISDGENGWLIEAGSTDQLRQTIEKLLLQPELLKSAGKAAMESAKKRPWDVYAHELLNAITNNN